LRGALQSKRKLKVPKSPAGQGVGEVRGQEVAGRKAAPARKPGEAAGGRAGRGIEGMAGRREPVRGKGRKPLQSKQKPRFFVNLQTVPGFC